MTHCGRVDSRTFGTLTLYSNLISFIVTLAPAAAEVDASLTKADTSMPANFNIFFSQQAIVHKLLGYGAS